MYTREERLAHNFFKQWHLRGEWYKLDIIPMIKDYIKKRIQENKKLPKYFVHLRPTCPLRKIETINKK